MTSSRGASPSATPGTLGAETPELALDENDEVIGYKYVNLSRMMEAIRKGEDAGKALEDASGTYGRFGDGVKTIDPRQE